MNKQQLKAIKEAHNQSYYQTRILSLVINCVNDIKNDRINMLNLEHREIKFEGYFIKGQTVFDIINEIRFNPNINTYLYFIEKNFCLGTVAPLYEISKDPDIKNCISDKIIHNKDITENLLNISAVVRHVFVHNYTETLSIRSHDLKKTVNDLKSKNNTLNLLYDAKKYFPDAYKKDFNYEIKLDLTKIQEEISFYNAISHKSLLFLGEFCNNIMCKMLNINNIKI